MKGLSEMKTKKLNFIEKLIICCAAIVSLTSIGNSTMAMNNGTYITYNTDETTKIFENWFEKSKPILKNRIEQIKNRTGQPPKVIILDSSGGYGLPDPVTNLTDIGRKCNDSVSLLLQKTIQKINEFHKVSNSKDEATNEKSEVPYLVVAFSPADATITEVHGDKMVEQLTILPEIPQVPPEKIRPEIANLEIKNNVYDHFYGMDCHKQAIELFAQKLAITLNDIYKQNICEFDEQNKKFKFPEKSILVLSIQTNNLDLLRNANQKQDFNPTNELNGKGYVSGNQTNNHKTRGFCIYFNPIDAQGKQFGENLKETLKAIPISPQQETNQILEPNSEKRMTELGAEGIPTALLFFDYTDNSKTQETLFDVDYLGRIAWANALAIEKSLGNNPRHSTTEITPVEQNGKVGCLIEATLEGDEIQNLESGHIVVWKRNSTNPNQVLWKETKIIKNQDGNPKKAKLYRSFIPEKEAVSLPDGTKVELNLQTQNENNNEYGINIYGNFKDTNGKIVQKYIPTNVNNFKIVKDHSQNNLISISNGVIYNTLAAESKRRDEQEFNEIESRIKQLAKEKSNLDL